MSRNKINALLIAITILVGIAGLVLWNISSSQSVLTKNPLTGQQQLTGGGAPKDKEVVPESGYQSTLLSDNTIFKLGLSDEEYQTIVKALTAYTKKQQGDKVAIIYTIDPKSVSYDDANRRFSFKAQIGQNSSQHLDIQVTRVEFNILQIRFSRDNQTNYDEKLKINPLL